MGQPSEKMQEYLSQVLKYSVRTYSVSVEELAVEDPAFTLWLFGAEEVFEAACGLGIVER